MFRTDTIPTSDNCFVQGGGVIWQQLHAERERVCAALVDRGITLEEATAAIHEFQPADESTRDVERKRLELLQGRLCSLDDALDRLMAGSYGLCSECGKPIGAQRLNLDAAISHCLACQSAIENYVA